MATIDRFEEVVDSGIIVDADDMEAPLSPQMKYDFMAAINAMPVRLIRRLIPAAPGWLRP